MQGTEGLYAAIDDSDAFARLAESAAAFCGTRSAVITRLDANGALLFGQMNYWPTEAFHRYYSDFLGDDPWRHAAVASGRTGAAIMLDRILPPRAFFETTMFNELLKPLGDDTARCLGMLSPPGGETLIVSIHRPDGSAEFDDGDAVRLEQVHGHLDRILRLRRLLEREHDRSRTLRDMVDRSRRAIMRIDRQLKISHVSAAAVALLDAADGIGIRNGCLAIDDGVLAQELRAAIVRMEDRHAAGRTAFLCRRPSFRRAYRIVVVPGGADPLDGAMLIIDDPDQTGGSRERAEAIRQAYGLTRAEAALAQGLMAGRTLDEIAAERQVGRETIRTQLRSLFQRTETRRQSELIALLASMPG